MLIDQRAVAGMRKSLRRTDSPGSGDRLGDRADAADARDENQRVGRRLAGEHGLKAAKKRGDDLAPAHHGPVLNVQVDFKIAFDAVERADDQSRHQRFFRVLAGGTSSRSAVALVRSRCGVAALDSAASATNQAFGMSVGRPMGMPPIFGVSAKA